MSMFPSVGSTVTKVLTNKSGTTAKVEFDDGTSLLVRYEALVVDCSEPEAAPVKESRVLMSGGLNIKNRAKPAIEKKSVVKQKVVSESQYKEMAAKALKKTQSRQDKLFNEWEHVSGQFDHEAGPTTLTPT